MDIDIRTLLGRLNPECKRAMEQAAELCVQQTHYNVDLEHLLLKLVDNDAPDLRLVFGRFGIRPDTVQAQLQKSLDTFKRGNGRTPSLAPDFAPLFQEAWLMSSMLLGQQHIRSGTLMLALLEVDRLRGRLVDAAPALLQIPRGALRDELAGLLQSSPEDAAASALNAAPASSAPAPSQPAAPSLADAGAAPLQMPTARRGNSATPSLDQYTVDLTQLARDGAIDPSAGATQRSARSSTCCCAAARTTPSSPARPASARRPWSKASRSAWCRATCRPRCARCRCARSTWRCCRPALA